MVVIKDKLCSFSFIQDESARTNVMRNLVQVSTARTQEEYDKMCDHKISLLEERILRDMCDHNILAIDDNGAYCLTSVGIFMVKQFKS